MQTKIKTKKELRLLTKTSKFYTISFNNAKVHTQWFGHDLCTKVSLSKSLREELKIPSRYLLIFTGARQAKDFVNHNLNLLDLDDALQDSLDIYNTLMLAISTTDILLQVDAQLMRKYQDWVTYKRPKQKLPWYHNLGKWSYINSYIKEINSTFNKFLN